MGEYEEKRNKEDGKRDLCCRDRKLEERNKSGRRERDNHEGEKDKE